MRRTRFRLGIGAGAIATLGAAVTLALVATPATHPAPSASPSVNLAGGVPPVAPQGRFPVPTPTSSPSGTARPADGGQTVDPAGTVAPAPPAHVRVPALHRLTPPDAVVRLRHQATKAQVRRLRHLPGIRQVLVLDRGTVAVPAGQRTVHLAVAGVPLGVRSFTPSLTAKSTRLWQSVARGELTVGYGEAPALAHKLGATLPVRAGKATAPVRVGALATLGVPGVQAVVSNAESRVLHLKAAREILVHAPAIPIPMLRADVHRAIGRVATFTVTRPQQIDQSEISAYARQMIPESYLELYRRAAPTCPGLPWTVLAGIGTVETDNGRNVARSVKGAEGPMQFMPATWRVWGVDADGDGKANIQDPVDAVFSAARYLCAAGASRGGQALDEAIFAYNHAWWYVREVVNLANAYA